MTVSRRSMSTIQCRWPHLHVPQGQSCDYQTVSLNRFAISIVQTELSDSAYHWNVKHFFSRAFPSATVTTIPLFPLNVNSTPNQHNLRISATRTKVKTVTFRIARDLVRNIWNRRRSIAIQIFLEQRNFEKSQIVTRETFLSCFSQIGIGHRATKTEIVTVQFLFAQCKIKKVKRR